MNRKHLYSLASVFFLGLLILISCKKEPVVDDPKDDNPTDTTTQSGPPAGTTPLPTSPQRGGDAQAGLEYLTYGDYVASGIPYSLFKTVFGDDNSNLLNRTGDNATIPINYTAVSASNGVRVVVPNCMQCHAQTLNGQLVMGLGNTTFDFTSDQSSLVPGVDLAINLMFGPNSNEWKAYEPFRKAVLATGPHLITEVVGANPADRLGAFLASHRNQDDLTWYDNQQFPITNNVVIPTDVPAWWLLKKKHAMFYAGAGRGDFSRIMMASGILTLKDSAEARVTDSKFPDVLAYIYSLKAPEYPQAIDQTKAATGKELFTAYCQKCHGSYGSDEFYPNLLVDLDVIGTDDVLSKGFSEASDYLDWYNGSWFSKGTHAARLETEGGYVAPPLDGIWATAPYLHNGSVPTLEDLLNSSQRPTYWRRSLDTGDLDYDKVGWNYSAQANKLDKQTYDATQPGYGNQGHTFGDILTDDQRSALIEYLKTL